MKNKYLFIILGLFIIFFLVGCQDKNDGLITMRIEDGTVTKTSAKVIISDNTEEENTYGDYFRVEKEINDKWQEVRKISNNYVFNDIAYRVIDNHELELTCDWKTIYGELEPGEYRIVKKVNNENELFTKFIIEDE